MGPSQQPAVVGAIHGRGSPQAAIVMVNGGLNGRGWAGHTHKTEENMRRVGRGERQPPDHLRDGTHAV